MLKWQARAVFAEDGKSLNQMVVDVIDREKRKYEQDTTSWQAIREDVGHFALYNAERQPVKQSMLSNYDYDIKSSVDGTPCILLRDRSKNKHGVYQTASNSLPIIEATKDNVFDGTDDNWNVLFQIGNLNIFMNHRNFK